MKKYLIPFFALVLLALPVSTSGADAPDYYVASSQSTKFHRPSCRSARRISPKNLVTYKTRDEALRAGLTPCKICRP